MSTFEWLTLRITTDWVNHENMEEWGLCLIPPSIPTSKAFLIQRISPGSDHRIIPPGVDCGMGNKYENLIMRIGHCWNALLLFFVFARVVVLMGRTFIDKNFEPTKLSFAFSSKPATPMYTDGLALRFSCSPSMSGKACEKSLNVN